MLPSFRSLPPLLQLTLLAALVHLSFTALHWGTQEHAEWLGQLFYQPVIILSTLAALQVTQRATRPWRAGLGLLCTGLLLHAAGDMVWAYLELFTQTPPFPSLADVLYLTAYPFYFLALLRLSALTVRRREAVRVALDSLVSVSVIASVLWWVFLTDLVQSNRSSSMELVTSLAYPLLDLVLLSLLFMVILAGKGMRRERLFLLAGVGSLVAADLGFLYREQTGGYTTGDPIDAFFSFSFVLLALGAWQFSRERTHPPRELVSLTLLEQGWLGWKMLPYLAVMGLCVLLWFLPHDGGLRHRGVVTGTIISMLLLMARQALAFSQNLRLTRELQQYTNELQLNREQLAHQAQHDALTNLPNRTLFEQRLTEALSLPLEVAQPLAVTFIDLDGFKQVNDTYGHEAGDVLLCQVASRLQRVLLPADTLARQGGDEFLVLLTLPPSRDPRQVSELLLVQFQEPFRVQGHEVRLSASIGVSLYPQDAREAGELRRCADVAMYRAKRAGQNEIRFFNEQGDGQPLVSAQQVSRRLRTAFENRLLMVHYQPQFDVKTQRIVAAEALLRWTDAELGSVPPSKFIPLAEDTGLIVQLGEWVVEQACQELANWRKLGWTGYMAINLSPVQLREEHFVNNLLGILERHGLRGTDIEIEITERTVAHDPEISRRLARLREAGIRLAVDDFGMGHASLLYLLDAEINVIKIDRHLVHVALNGEHERRILEALVTFARGLRLELVAEGVETPAQLALVQRLGVQTVQGYLTGRPQEAAAFAQLLRQTRAGQGAALPPKPVPEP